MPIFRYLWFTTPLIGIWDCLSSQQVVNFVRYQVSEGKDLKEIGEMMCEHCLAPDTSSGAGIGCDNMTVLIVALLHGRTKEEWAAWVTDRVKNEYGYKTPSTLPQLYAQSRLMSFRVRREAQEARDRARQEQGSGDDMSGLGFGSGGLGQFARVLGSTGGISFHPGSAIMSDNGPLMFGSDDSEDEDSGEEDLENGGRSYFKERILGPDDESTDPMQKLQAQLDEYEKDDHDIDEDGHSSVPQDAAPEVPSSPAPEEPPKKLANGDAKVPPAEQLSSLPAGDAPHPVTKAEGLMDTSEDPLKV